MRIVYCIGSLAYPGGTERVLSLKANYLAENMGYDVHIFIIDQNDRKICYDLSPKVYIHDLNISSKIRGLKIPGFTYLSLLKWLRKTYTTEFHKISPDIVIVVERGYHDFVIPYVLPHIPKIREFHFSFGGVIMKSKILGSFVQKVKYQLTYKALFRQFKLYDRLVLLTNGEKNEKVYSNNTVVIENMLDTFPESLSNCEKKRVISVGSMDDDRKGFHKQIEIWKNICSRHPDWTLNIYGDGQKRDFLQSMIDKYNLTSKVILHGRSNKIYDEMAQSSIFIMTSEAEGLPMVLIEAMACGLPCVAYDCPTGPSDIISSGIDGFVVEMNKEDSFIARLDLLISDIQLRKDMGGKAKKNIKKYSPDNIMSKWLRLFHELKEKNDY